MDPLTITLILMGIGLVGGAMKGTAESGAILRNAAAQRTASYMNASIMESNASLLEGGAIDALQRGAQREGMARMAGTRTMSEQRTGYAAGGVDVHSGSALDVGAGTAAVTELDAQIIKNNAWRDAWGLDTQGKNMRKQAGYQRQIGDITYANAEQTGADTALGDVLGGVMPFVGPLLRLL